METNETILTRDVVVLDSRKRMGSIKGVCVDCDTLAVSHYLVNNTSTGTTLVLPFQNALSVGDTFMTVQNRDDFLAANDAEVNNVLQNGYRLLDAETFSKTGNRLGKVVGFDFDPVGGAITRLNVSNQSSYASDAFVFFSPEFVFVDDGEPTALERRQTPGEPADVANDEDSVTVVEVEETIIVVEDEDGEASADDAEPADASDESQVDEEIIAFLLDATLTADVESDDGEFRVAEGTVLTREIIEEANLHDAVLLLTINVDA